MSRWMCQFVLIAVFVAGEALAQGPILVWDDFHPPVYPRSAQIAHIMGPVTIEFTLQPNNAVAIKKSTGHPLLVAAAEETIKSSQLHCINCPDDAAIFAIVFDFTFANHDCDEAGKHPSSSAKLESSTHISFIAEPVCTIDPATVTTRRYRKVRSIQCLYLWRCKRELEYSSTSYQSRNSHFH
ncbi:MAG TPA: energy transducer TonB [Candidatus Angelobacter sp.]|nr:energy transducer TonB [Candidatus Angelobacter sp.]